MTFFAPNSSIFLMVPKKKFLQVEKKEKALYHHVSSCPFNWGCLSVVKYARHRGKNTIIDTNAKIGLFCNMYSIGWGQKKG